VDTWLEVVPQLIARIDAPAAQVASLLHRLLLRVSQCGRQGSRWREKLAPFMVLGQAGLGPWVPNPPTD
jgi:hypothetical protein